MKNSSNPEEALRSGSMPTGNGGKKAAGNRQAESEAPSGESNHETLRHGSKPKPEAVREAQHDKAAQKRAHGFNERSQNGGANPNGGY